MKDKKKKASIRLKYQVLQMKKHIQKNQISYKHISRLTDIDAKTIWSFVNGYSNGGNALTFLMIADSIGYEIDVKLKNQQNE